MSIVPKKDLAALGLTPEMLGTWERLDLPQPVVDEARGPAFGDEEPGPALALYSVASSRMAWPDVRDGHSDVLAAIGVAVRLDVTTRAVELTWDARVELRVRAAHPGATPRGAHEGPLRLPLRQLGRFLLETAEGQPLVIGAADEAALVLAAVTPWPSPPIEDWMLPMNDAWLESIVRRTLPDADVWTRTALAGTITRLTDIEAPPASNAAALLAALAHSPAMAPRAWVRALDRRSLAAIEEHARRRAVALELALDDLLDVLPLDAEATREAWTSLCHRRDDLESIRVLLAEAGTGDHLVEVLRETDRAGRALRVNLTADASTDDERLRRVALGDPAAWWGDPRFEVRLL